MRDASSRQRRVEAQSRQRRVESRALAIAFAWMLLTQPAFALLWDAGWLTRQSSLVHWLLVGVLPPALTLWRMRPAGVCN